MTYDHPDFPYRLPPVLAAVQDLVEEFARTLEALAEASPEFDAAITDLGVTITEARLAWGERYDTTPNTNPTTGMPESDSQ